MFAYIIRRLLLVPPTLFAIIVINFAVVQVLPGGPVEQLLAQLTGEATDATGRVSGNVGNETGGGTNVGESKAQSGKDAGGPVVIAALRDCRRNSSRIWNASSGSTNRPTSVSG